MWRSRRWRYLLNLIDHLPRNSYLSQAVADDEEHTRLMLEARERAGKSDEPHFPPMSQWSQEAGILADLVDEIRGLRYVTIAANSGGSKPPPPVRYARPQTAADRIRADMRREKHEALANRILSRRHKTTDGG